MATKSPAARIADRSILDEDLLCALEDELAALNKEAADESDSIISGKEAKGRGELVRPKSKQWFCDVVAAAERQLLYGNSQAWCMDDTPRPNKTSRGKQAKRKEAEQIRYEVLYNAFELINSAQILAPDPLEAFRWTIEAGVVQLSAKACDEICKAAASVYDDGSRWKTDKSFVTAAVNCCSSINHIANCHTYGCRIPFDLSVLQLAAKQFKSVDSLMRGRMKMLFSHGLDTLSRRKEIEEMERQLGSKKPKREDKLPAQNEMAGFVLRQWSGALLNVGCHRLMPPEDQRVPWEFGCAYPQCIQRARKPKPTDWEVISEGYKQTELSKRCSRCQVARYDSPECQSADWKRHKVECKALK